jgi:hypothetical protein
LRPTNHHHNNSAGILASGQAALSAATCHTLSHA